MVRAQAQQAPMRASNCGTVHICPRNVMAPAENGTRRGGASAITHMLPRSEGTLIRRMGGDVMMLVCANLTIRMQAKGREEEMRGLVTVHGSAHVGVACL